MINFKELFQLKNQNKILEVFKDKFSKLSEEEFKKYSNFIDKDGNTLLHHAMKNNCFLLADYFYKNNIGTNIINNDGQEVLHSISEGKIIKYTVESETSDDNLNLSNMINNKYKDTQSETELDKSFFTENKSNENKLSKQEGGTANVQDNKELEENKKEVEKKQNQNIRYTKSNKEKYIDQGKKLLEYVQNISNSSENITKIAKMYNLNLDNPNDLLFAKYKQAGLYDYISNKYPNLIMKEMIKLLNFNINKENLDSIDAIRVKNKIMKCFKILKQ